MPPSDDLHARIARADFVVFPGDASTAIKGSLLGSMVLLDFSVYETASGGCIIIQW